jgi:hypothetical protein
MGAVFNEGFMYLNRVSRNGNLVTGQNPWSTWKVAEGMIEQMGFTPKRRATTSEENTIAILEVYETDGYKKAKEAIDERCSADILSVDRRLLAMHSIVAAMQFEMVKAINLIRLLSYSNGYL